MDYYEETENTEFETEDNEAEAEYIQSIEEKRKSRSLLLILIQLIITILIILAAVTVKLIGGTVHSTVGTWFYEHYNNSVWLDTAEGLLPFEDSVKYSEKDNELPENAADEQNENIISKLKKTMKKPLKKTVLTSAFGERELENSKENHKGIDLGADEGTQIFAALDGEVTIAKEDSSYGNYIVLTHADGVKTLYAHCSKLLVKKGKKIKAGDKIALVGSTGQAYGSHLHFEILINGENIDPAAVIKIDEKTD
ncbi:MAG: M23 family metallopeptidase [Clostridia bacterium]|nr:M23 family metallopeptidase [Clostridia bacterium]